MARTKQAKQPKKQKQQKQEQPSNPGRDRQPNPGSMEREPWLQGKDQPQREPQPMKHDEGEGHQDW
jgi:hypothetical protein